MFPVCHNSLPVGLHMCLTTQSLSLSFLSLPLCVSLKITKCNKCSLKVTIHSPLGCICAPESNCIGTFATEKGTYVTWREHLQHFEKQCVPNVPPMSHLCPLPSLSFFLLSLSPSLSPKLIKCNKCSLKVTIHSPLGHIWLESWNHWSWKPIRSEL